jgi:hypothetical protein
VHRRRVEPPLYQSPDAGQHFAGACLGEIDHNWTATNSYGGSVQATYNGEVVDHATMSS